MTIDDEGRTKSEGTDKAQLEALQMEVESGRYAVSTSELAGRIIDAHTKAAAD